MIRRIVGWTTLVGLAGKARGRGRTLTATLALLVGTTCGMALCAVFGLFTSLDHAGTRNDARQPGPYNPNGCIVELLRFDPVGDNQYERLVLARSPTPQCATVAPPPGLLRWPRDGEVFVSPQLRSLANHDTTIAARMPRVDSLIDTSGLVSATELRMVVGGDFNTVIGLPSAQRFDRFGVETGWIAGYLRMSRSALMIFTYTFVLPVILYLAYAVTSLDLKMRLRQVSVLELLGMGPIASRATLASAVAMRVTLGSALGALLAWWWE